MQTFTYEDESMMSEKNKFTRDGYKFTGFLYTYNGNSKLITTPEEFREMLLALGPNSKITLIAQWEKIKVQVKIVVDEVYRPLARRRHHPRHYD